MVWLNGGNRILNGVFHKEPLRFRQTEELVRQIIDFFEHVALARLMLKNPTGWSKPSLNRSDQRIRRRLRSLPLGHVVRLRKRKAQEFLLLYLWTLRPKRRGAVKREPQHQPAVEQSGEQFATALVSPRNSDGLNDVPERHRVLGVGCTQPLSSIAGGDATSNQHARSPESPFETSPMNDAVLPRAQSLGRPDRNAELVYRQERERGDNAAVFALVRGVMKPFRRLPA